MQIVIELLQDFVRERRLSMRIPRVLERRLAVPTGAEAEPAAVPRGVEIPRRPYPDRAGRNTPHA